MRVRPMVLAGLLGALLAGVGLAGEAVLLEESFTTNQRGWVIDEFSALESGGYAIDARQQGGYYRWLATPADLTDMILSVELKKLRGNNDAPFYGLLFRVQETWRDSYFFVINGSGAYRFGKFQGGRPKLLKSGVSAASGATGTTRRLVVRCHGGLFGLALDDQPLANVLDDSFAAGRIGLCVEAPAKVWFDNLRVTTLAGLPGGPDDGPPLGPAVLYADDFTARRGWTLDAYRELRDGAYHLHNAGEAKSFLSWQPATAGLTDGEATIDARIVEGSPKQLHGVVWRLRDASHFYFFLIGSDGQFYAGLVDGGETRVLRRGRQLAVRPAGETNTLRVRAEGRQFSCFINDEATCSFTDATYARGAFGVYLEQPGRVAFDNLRITDLPERVPPVVGGPVAGSGWPAGRLLLDEPLTTPSPEKLWPVDDEHRFDHGGYCVRAPAEGSRTTIRTDSFQRADGVYTIRARPVSGSLTGSYGLVVGANRELTEFVYLLLNATGRYYVGRARGRQFETIELGSVGRLQGGEAGNLLQLTVRGDEVEYGFNDQLHGRLRLPGLKPGAVGLHVENGVEVCFQQLRVYALPEDGRRG